MERSFTQHLLISKGSVADNIGTTKKSIKSFLLLHRSVHSNRLHHAKFSVDVAVKYSRFVYSNVEIKFSA